MQLWLVIAGLRLLYQGELCGSPLKDSALRPGLPEYWITGTYDRANRRLEVTIGDCCGSSPGCFSRGFVVGITGLRPSAGRTIGLWVDGWSMRLTGVINQIFHFQRC
eukprot:jgi/Botrbrau1/6221/Bobra.0109s0016.1